MARGSVRGFLGELYQKSTAAFESHAKDDKICGEEIGPVITEVLGRSLPEDQIQNQASLLKFSELLGSFHI